MKSVTGAASNEAVVYVNKFYPGSSSDVAIVEHSKAGEVIHRRSDFGWQRVHHRFITTSRY